MAVISGTGSVELPQGHVLEGLTVYGKSVQDGTPTPDAPVEVRSVRGRNLANIVRFGAYNGTLTELDNGYRFVVSSAANSTYMAFFMPMPDSGDYYFSLKSAQVSFYRICVGETSVLDSVGSDFAKFKNSFNASPNFTLTVPASEQPYMVMLIYTGNNVAAGTVIDLTDIQLERGSAPTHYAPYGCVAAVARGKNLWDEEWELGSFNTTTGANINNKQQIRAKNKITVMPGATYFVNSPSYVWMIFFDGNNQVITEKPTGNYASSGNSIGVGTGGYAKSVVMPASCRSIRFYCQIMYGTTYNNDICINVSDPDFNGQYEPYHESVSYIDLQGEELCSLPDGTQDVLTVDASGHAVIEKRVGVNVLSGGALNVSNQSWLVNLSPYPDASGSGSYGDTANILCSHMPAATRGAVTTGTAAGISFQGQSNTGVWMNAGDSSITTVALANAWLTANPVIVVYPLKTPYTIDLGYIELPDVRGASTLSVIAEVEPQIDVELQPYSVAGGGASMNGRNLLRFTESPTYAGNNNTANRQIGWCRWNASGTVARTDEGIKYTQDLSTSLGGFVIPLVSETLLQGGADEVLTLSFLYRGTLTGTTQIYMLANTGGNVRRYSDVSFVESETDWQMFEQTLYFPTLGTRYGTSILIPYTAVAGAWLEVKDGTMKLEYGTTATPWRPAPEDTDQPSDLVYASEGVDLGDTSGDKLVANINLAGDTAKISASHVEINGQATFTAIKQYSDAAYDASGAATGAVNALKTDLASASGTTVIDGGHISTNSLTVGHVSGLQGTLDGKASTTDVANAAKTATNYIEANPTDGIKVHDSGDVTTFVQIASGVIDFVRSGVSAMKMWMDNSVAKVRVGLETAGHSVFSPEGMEVFTDADTSVASFGSASRIGKAYDPDATDNESHMKLDYHSLQLVDKSNSTYFHVSDRLDRSGTCLVTEVFVVGNSNVSVGSVDVYMTPSLHTLHNTGLGSGEIIGVESVQGDGVTFSSERVYDGDIRATPSDLTKLVDGFKITVIYETNSSLAKAYTAGVRSSNPAYSNYPGAMSFAEGVGGVASGTASHVEGVDLGSDYGTQLMSTGLASHAEGINSEASGNGSHAEGFRAAARGIYSHAEGTGTAASGSASHAEGYVAAASGDYSHAEGYETAATGRCSHAEGRDTNARGLASHAQNRGTVALAAYQTVLGQYNVEDAKTVTFTGDGNRITFSFVVSKFSDFISITVDDVDVMGKVTRSTSPYTGTDTLVSVIFKEADTPADGAIVKVKYSPGDYALIIGNGTNDNYRSNALAVKWNGDVEIDDGRIEISDSGWQTLPLNGNAFKVFNGDASYTPMYRKVNGIVEVTGGVSPLTAQTLGETGVTIGTLPTGFRPASNRTVQVICQGSGRKLWLMRIDSSGVVSAQRMRDMGSTSYQSMSTTEWMIFTATFLAG